MPPEPITYRRAAFMRRHLTQPEARLWAALKGQKVQGLKFRRQHPVGRYILDFYCASAKLGIEIDGAVHDDPDQMAHDQRRTAWLAEQGIRLIRFPAASVRNNLDGVVAGILAEVGGR
ncbi:endonuclease domain-containing protein [Brevundimonas goettingensis]|jgi:very-short-patch-repair endonuclease|uniref:Endonuclease domain-containing protein n=1 Tax=Brevundimonas goettingensis TaxID=2774190 RepID=A0A975BYE8_9CAUL|nr:endonuclease domain-containing protein [Brevundimonas goettingensis]QTC89788.1 endonuclease domain-containing protein [Brevundimonas goettingensis]